MRGDADSLTRFFGTFNFALGAVSFLLQLLLVGPMIRRFGLSRTLLVLPTTLAAGSALIVLAPGAVSVLLTNAFDQGFRFSLDAMWDEVSTLNLLTLVPALKVPVVILAATSSSPDIQRAYAFGANTFITKPSDLNKLVSDLQVALTHWLPQSLPPIPKAGSSPSRSIEAT